MGARTSTIQFNIQLDEQNIPDKISWNASDEETKGDKDCRAVMLALWDHQQKSGLSIDLWTKEMTVQEMNLFFYQTLMTMGDTFLRATQNKELSNEIQKFASDFLNKVKQQEKSQFPPING